MGNSSSKNKGAPKGDVVAVDGGDLENEIPTGVKSKRASGMPNPRASTIPAAPAFKKILVGEEELAQKEQELETANAGLADATREVETLREQHGQLEVKCSMLQRQKEEEVTRLQGELARELEGQLRVAETLTQERDVERKRAMKAEEQVRALTQDYEAKIRATQAEGEEKLRVAEQQSANTVKALDVQMEGLRRDVGQQQQKTEEALSAKRTSEEQAQNTQQKLHTKLQSLERKGRESDEQIAAAQLKMQEAGHSHAQVAAELDLTKKQLLESRAAHETLQKEQATTTQASPDLQGKLAAAEQAKEDLERKYNESVSKKSALHEAFEALKMELKESYERYQTARVEAEEGKKGAERELQEARKAAAEAEAAVRIERDALKGDLEALKRAREEEEEAVANSSSPAAQNGHDEPLASDVKIGEGTSMPQHVAA